MDKRGIIRTRNMTLVQDREGNVFKAFLDAIPKDVVIKEETKDLVLVQDPSTKSIYKVFRADLEKMDPSILVSDSWGDSWGDSSSIVDLVKRPVLKDFLAAHPELKFVPVREFK